MKKLNDKVLELIKEIQDTFPGKFELPEVNENVLGLIFDIQDTFKDEPEFAKGIIRDLTRISNLLLLKELKKFDDETTE